MGEDRAPSAVESTDQGRSAGTLAGRLAGHSPSGWRAAAWTRWPAPATGSPSTRSPPGNSASGDIVALNLGETVVVHRFLMVRAAGDGRRWFCQKGDNSPAWSWGPPGNGARPRDGHQGPGSCPPAFAPPLDLDQSAAGRWAGAGCCWPAASGHRRRLSRRHGPSAVSGSADVADPPGPAAPK